MRIWHLSNAFDSNAESANQNTPLNRTRNCSSVRHSEHTSSSYSNVTFSVKMSDCLCSNCVASQMDSTFNHYSDPVQDSPLDLSEKSTRTAAATAPPVEPPVLPPTNFTTLKDRNSGRVMYEEDDLKIFRQACKEKIASEKARLYGYFGSITNRLVETVFQHLENELESGSTGPTEHNGQLLNFEERFNKKFEWATQVFHNTTWDLARRVRKYDPANLDVLRAPTV